MTERPKADPFETGVAKRREVLGDAWVDRQLGQAKPFAADFQEFITRYAWGEVWSRPGLEPHVRSVITLSICIALGRWEEFRLHARAALENTGHTPETLKEIVLQAAIYAGVPAANTAMHHAQEVLDGLKSD